MELFEALKGRRSVRGFKEEQIKDEELNAILEAGEYAASGMGKQSSIMIVVQDKETIAKLSKMNAKIMENENVDPFYGAPTVVIVLADKNRPTCVEDGSLVMGNLMNAAYGLGVGSCWIHRAKEEFESEEGKELLKSLGISGDYEGIGHCVLGYADCEEPTPAKRKDDYVYYID